MKREYIKKGFKDIFGAAAKSALKQCIWVIPTLGVLSLIQAKAYELEAEENEEAPTEEQTSEETPTEESNDESAVSGSSDENIQNLEKELNIE